VRGEQTEEVLTLRQACLDQQLEEVRVLVGLLAQADASMVEKGDKIVFGLEPLAQCANVTALRAPGLPAPEIRDAVSALSKKVAEAKANLVAGKVMAGLVAAQACIDGAKKIGYEPLIAEARIVHGAGLLTSGNFEAAATDFTEAVYAAIRGKRDDLAADAGVSMAMVASDAGGKPAEARIWLGHAEAAATRLGVDRALERRWLEVAGIIAAESGDTNTAIAMHEKMLGVAAASLGKDAPEMFAHEVELGTTYSRAGAYAKAAEHYEHARALREKSVGPDNPDIGLILSNLGAAYAHTNEPAKARAAFERALVIREKYYGKNSPIIVPTLDNFAELLRKQGDLPTALAYQERALALCKVIPGMGHPMYHQLATDYSDTLVAAKRYADAHKQFDAIFALEDTAKSPVLPATQTSRAELALAEKKWLEARTFATKAIAGYEAAGGVTDPHLWRPLTVLARAEIGDNKPRAARPPLERALAIAKKAQIPDDDIGPTRELVAHLPP
jgi:tetratricopeptide (TPR) repeat protein